MAEQIRELLGVRAVAVAASGLFIQVEIGHFRSHGRPQEVAEAIARGDAGLRAEMNP